MVTAPRLVHILGDQLSPDLASLRAADPGRDIVLMCEVAEEANYVRHHKKKIALIFAAMRHFADALRVAGWQVDYIRLDDPDNAGSFTGEVARAVARHRPASILVTEPGEWRVREAMRGWHEAFDLPVEILEDDRFLCSHREFSSWAAGRKQLRMEYFYREMRRRTGFLMQGDAPEGGKWNYDAENRKPPRDDLSMPGPLRFQPDAETRDVLHMVGARFADHFGDLEPFWFAVTRQQAKAALSHFIAEALPRFGDYQDAMLQDERFLYHSVLSAYLNIGLLGPLDVCKEVEAAYRSGQAPLNAAEGFIRQIIGWREFVRGIYWREMPGYVERNFFGHDRPLPDFYWSAETDMACLRASITQTKEEAYAHHIQRLMITGNFAMLAGIDPKAVHEWYLSVYADAFEWVELPNTLGMSQFADGGLLGSKPYAAGGNYINRMSDYCTGCRFDVKQKTGSDACPFNTLYWDFLARHEDRLRGNPRLAQVYRTWDRMADETRLSYRDQAAGFLATL
ncbi:MAG: cryptochrome/photolyase family protein [Alphaproteobacteria bacterium]|nr:cryptochrome/photolyase family protein [Alphaproteobacteria bacterium]